MPDSSTPSQALGAGRKRFASLDTKTCPAGQDLPPVSRSVTQDNGEGKMTNDTSHRSGSISSVSTSLQFCLGNKLKQRLGTDGSMIYSMRWKTAATPAGRQYCQLVASARRISASDCSLERSGWTTPQAHDTSGRSTGQKAKHGTKHGCACLVRDVELAGWPTPTTRDHKDGSECPNVQTNSLLGREVWQADQPIRITADGQVLTGSDAGTVSSGQLNPRFSGWLMGYPVEWCKAALSAHQTRSPKNRRRGS